MWSPSPYPEAEAVTDETSTLSDRAQRHAAERALDLLNAYAALGDPDRLQKLLAEAGLTVHHFQTWTGATRLPSVEAFLEAELLPIGDLIEADVPDPVGADAARELAPFVSCQGSITAPIDVHLVAAGGAR